VRDERATPEGSRWGVVRADVPVELEEPLVAVTAEGALGATFEPLGEGRGRLEIWAASEERAADLAVAVRAVLIAAARDPDSCRLRVEGLPDGRWVERYQAGLQPFALSERFAVDPGGRGRTVPGRTTIDLVPGRAFGTGEHPTTRLCAAALERRVRRGSRWVDVGCGSGILCVVADLLGAGAVLGVDVDAQAVEVARRVLAANRAGRGVELRVGSCAAAGPRAWDGIVANVEAAFFLREAASVSALLLPAGRLLACGILREDCGEVAGALEGAGLREVGRAAEDGWCLLDLEREERA
jgi:ribosomal protein L11 methyltransferase